jgi:hypothetical protein
LITLLLLVCFVENASRHGVPTNITQPVALFFNLTVMTPGFCLYNAKQAQPKNQLGGVGLANVRRPVLLYPVRHTLTVADTFTDF